MGWEVTGTDMKVRWFAHCLSQSCHYFLPAQTEPEDDELGRSYYQENEDQLQQRLVQLLNLPIHHVTPSLEDASESVQQLDESDSFLSLDCPALAASLSSLPLHQVLGISSDLVQLCDMDAESRNAESTLATAAAPPVIDLSVCTRKREYTFEFKAPGMPSLVSSLVCKSSAEDKDDWLQHPNTSVLSAWNGGEDNPQKNETLEMLSEPEKLGGSGGVQVSGRRDATGAVSRLAQDRPHKDEGLDRLLAETKVHTVEPTPGKLAQCTAQEHSNEPDRLQLETTVHTIEPTPGGLHSNELDRLLASHGVHTVEPRRYGAQSTGSTVEHNPSDLERPAQVPGATVEVTELDDMLDDLLS